MHNWLHKDTYSKWYYMKDPKSSWDWWNFENALHTPASEKIVSMYRYGTGGDGSRQLWALIDKSCS